MLDQTAKFPKDSLTEMNEIVLPNDTNTLNNLMGGKLLHWMDICAAIAAQKHSNSIVVTASVDSVSFKESIRLRCCNLNSLCYPRFQFEYGGVH